MDTNKLTTQRLRTLTPLKTVQKIADGGGLYLEVRPSGGKFWRYAFRWHGRQQTFTIGQYPDVPLAAARLAHQEARRLLAQGVNPCVQKRQEEESARNTVQMLAELWAAHHLREVSEGRKTRVESLLRRYILPAFGRMSVSEVTGGTIIRWARRLEDTGVGPTAIINARQILGMVLDEAVARDMIPASPLASPAVRRSVKKPKTKHLSAPIEPAQAAEALRLLWKATEAGDALSRLCRALPYLAVRPMEAAAMRWDDIDLEAREWRFVTPKTDQPHIVPLSRQVLDILGPPQPSGWVFPSSRLADGHIHKTCIPRVFQFCGLANILTPHGCRAMFRTLASERLGYNFEVLELQLAHRIPGPMGATYQRARYLDQRHRLMQEYADYIDGLREVRQAAGEEADR
jgi:integrase